MITEIQAKAFKSWEDTGQTRLAPLTVLFGTNSSGKTSILQLLLMLKQTVESADRKRGLQLGGDIIDLGTFSDLIYCHDSGRPLEISISWDLLKPLRIRDPEKKDSTLFEIPSLKFDVAIDGSSGSPAVRKFAYSFTDKVFGVRRMQDTGTKKSGYEIDSSSYELRRRAGHPWPLPSPVKFYGFPDEVGGYYQNVGFLSDIVLELEGVFRHIAYLGPLRQYPSRIYTWAGEEPSDVGRKGELAIAAALAARRRGAYISPGFRRPKKTLEERIAFWLKEMGMIESFSINQIAENRKEYEVKVKTARQSPEVVITDVGFGLSQVLPVLVMCYYVPEGSVLLLEQPELHLHPSAQGWLADVFIDVANNRNVQLLVESHSEHLLRRLQRRIAEGEIKNDKTALYFCRMKNSSSITEKLDVDIFGNISNWPEGFFGDEMGEMVAQTQAAMDRRNAAP